MTLMRRGGGAAESDNNIFWTTMSDLMLGLAIVFMTLFVFAMTGFSQQSIKQRMEQIQVNKELVEKLNQANINAEVDSLTGDIKISDLELFELGSYKLSKKGENYLNKFVPIYIDTVFAKEDVLKEIESVVVQGHTDSQMFAGIKDPNEQYLKNMTLSMQRANSVAEYMFKTNYDKKYTEPLKKLLIVEGRSFSSPVIVNGKEDYNKSRRVELRLKIKKLDIIDMLFNGAFFW